MLELVAMLLTLLELSMWPRGRLILIMLDTMALDMLDMEDMVSGTLDCKVWDMLGMVAMVLPLLSMLLPLLDMVLLDTMLGFMAMHPLFTMDTTMLLTLRQVHLSYFRREVNIQLVDD